MTALYKNNAFQDDQYIAVDGEAPVPVDQNLVVSLSYFKENREALVGRNHGQLGVVLEALDEVSEIVEDLGKIDMVALDFPSFANGTSFSKARLLRDEFGYEGEVRALGDVRIDQIPLMVRCGFDAFLVSHEATLKALEAGKRVDVDLYYQPAASNVAVGEKPIAGKAWARR